MDVNDAASLKKAVAKHNLVVLLVPHAYHVAVVKAVIKDKTDVVMTSYVSPVMQELGDRGWYHHVKRH